MVAVIRFILRKPYLLAGMRRILRVQKAEVAAYPRRSRVKLYQYTANPWQRRRCGIIAFPEGEKHGKLFFGEIFVSGLF